MMATGKRSKKMNIIGANFHKYTEYEAKSQFWGKKKRKTYLNADQDKHKNWAPSCAASEVHRHQSRPVQHEPGQPLKLMFASCQNIFKNIFPTIGSSYTEHSSDIIFGARNAFFSPVFPWIHSINASCMCRIKYWPCLVNILPNRCLLD